MEQIIGHFVILIQYLSLPCVMNFSVKNISTEEIKPIQNDKEEVKLSLYIIVDLKLNIQKMKIMASCPITSWEIYGETVETVSDYFSGFQNHCRW